MHTTSMKGPQVELPYQGNLCINIFNAQHFLKNTQFRMESSGHLYSICATQSSYSTNPQNKH